MTRFQRAEQIWLILILASRDRTSYTYGDLAEILGMPGAGRTMQQFLGPIMWYCDDNNYPPLTVLIVNQDTGVPGDGLTTIDPKNVNKEREKVYDFNWFAIDRPTNDDLEEAEEE